jgi:hypothetical protein
LPRQRHEAGKQLCSIHTSQEALFVRIIQQEKREMTIEKHPTSASKKRDRHVIFCDYNGFAVKGSQAELNSVQFLLDSLRVETVGDYRVLVNYNLVEKGNGNSLEVDLVLINRLGIFLLEIKDWQGRIEAYDNAWVCHGKGRKNPWKLIDYKARVFHSLLFESGGAFAHLGQVSVTGLVVLTRGLQSFHLHSKDNAERILALNSTLTEALSSSRLLHRGNKSCQLSDVEIQEISSSLYTRYQPRETIVGDYRIVKDLVLKRDLCITFEAQNRHMPTQRVRLKRYQLPSLDQAAMEYSIRQFRRSIQAVIALGFHPHILTSLTFFADELDHQQDVFYEITELPTGPGLDEIMKTRARQLRSMSFAQQLTFVRSIGLALQHAHNHRDEKGRPAPIYHRNICPETVFQMRDTTVKLGDFDFAKLNDETISVPGQTLLAKPYTAPELLADSSQASPRSDIYALGVLWYYIASLPAQPKRFVPEEIETLDLPAEARSLLKRMTAEKPAERPARIEEVLDALALSQES